MRGGGRGERRQPFAKYGLTKPSVLGDEPPHAIGWRQKCRHQLPDGPGTIHLGIGNEVVFVKLAETSIREMVNGLLDDAEYFKRFDNVAEHATAGLNRDLTRSWIAWWSYRPGLLTAGTTYPAEPPLLGAKQMGDCRRLTGMATGTAGPSFASMPAIDRSNHAAPRQPSASFAEAAPRTGNT